jgi:SAM-dependent MidA family methyltransferase
MEACLYDPEDGYYMRPGRKTGPGDDADFATSPTLHPFFGAAVGKEIALCWDRLGRPGDFQAVEFGGGEGHLARDALAWMDGARPELARLIRWVHVERSPRHRAAQSQHPDPRISWAPAMPTVDDGFVVANEFLDALPFRWLERTPGGWAEVCVTLSANRFVELLRPVARGSEASWPDLPVGMRTVAHDPVAAWFAAVGGRLRRGGVLVMDYGDRGGRLWGPDRPDGTVRAFCGHRLAGSVLDDPGEKDITASIDFSRTLQWAQAVGLRESSFETQEAFLLRHGVLEALNATDRTTRQGASGYLRLRHLLLPTGLGAAFKVQGFECPPFTAG